MGRVQLRNNMRDALIKTINWMPALKDVLVYKRNVGVDVFKGFNANECATTNTLESNINSMGSFFFQFSSRYVNYVEKMPRLAMSTF